MLGITVAPTVTKTQALALAGIAGTVAFTFNYYPTKLAIANRTASSNSGGAKSSFRSMDEMNQSYGLQRAFSGGMAVAGTVLLGAALLGRAAPKTLHVLEGGALLSGGGGGLMGLHGAEASYGDTLPEHTAKGPGAISNSMERYAAQATSPATTAFLNSTAN